VDALDVHLPSLRLEAAHDRLRLLVRVESVSVIFRADYELAHFTRRRNLACEIDADVFARGHGVFGRWNEEWSVAQGIFLWEKRVSKRLWGGLLLCDLLL